MKGCVRRAGIALAGVLVLLVVGSGGPAPAQVPGYSLNPANRPAVSPYINLLRTGTSPGINYYGLVRPEITFGNSLFQLQGQQANLASQQQELLDYSTLPATGHKSGFQTQGKYFMSSGGQGPTGGFAPSITSAAPKSGKRY
jgi:hypothetical protein